MTWRYAAFSLAHEFRVLDVDTMLAGMDTCAFMEWLEYFRVKNELADEERAKAEAKQKQQKMRQGLIHNFTDLQAGLEGKVLRK